MNNAGKIREAIGKVRERLQNALTESEVEYCKKQIQQLIKKLKKIEGG